MEILPVLGFSTMLSLSESKRRHTTRRVSRGAKKALTVGPNPGNDTFFNLLDRRHLVCIFYPNIRLGTHLAHHWNWYIGIPNSGPSYMYGFPARTGGRIGRVWPHIPGHNLAKKTITRQCLSSIVPGDELRTQGLPPPHMILVSVVQVSKHRQM